MCSSFKSESLVIMQALAASSFWPEPYNLSVRFTVARYYASHSTLGNPEYLFTFTLLLRILLEFTKTSVMVETL